MTTTTPLVVNKKTRVLYKFLGDDSYKNLQTGVVGKLKSEDAVKYFSVPIRLNQMVMNNPSLIDFIELGLFNFYIMDDDMDNKSLFYAESKK